MLGMIAERDQSDQTAAGYYEHALEVLAGDHSIPVDRHPLAYLVRTRLAEVLERLGEHATALPLREALAEIAASRRNSRDLWIHSRAQVRALVALERHDDARTRLVTAIDRLPEEAESTSRATFALTETMRTTYDRDEPGVMLEFAKSILGHKVFRTVDAPYPFMVYAEAFVLLERSQVAVDPLLDDWLESEAVSMVAAVELSAFRRAGARADVLRRAAVDTAVTLARRSSQTGDAALAEQLLDAADEFAGTKPTLVPLVQRARASMERSPVGP